MTSDLTDAELNEIEREAAILCSARHPVRLEAFPCDACLAEVGVDPQPAPSEKRIEAGVRALDDYDCVGGMPWEEVVPIVLAAADAAGIDPPIAWRWRDVAADGKPERWAYGAFPPFLEPLAFGRTWETQPLYAHENPGSEGVDLARALADALRKILAWAPENETTMFKQARAALAAYDAAAPPTPRAETKNEADG